MRSITDASVKRLQKILEKALKRQKNVSSGAFREPGTSNWQRLCMNIHTPVKWESSPIEHNFYWQEHNSECIKSILSTLQTGKAMVLKLKEAFTASLKLNQQLLSVNIWKGISYMVWGNLNSWSHRLCRYSDGRCHFSLPALCLFKGLLM